MVEAKPHPNSIVAQLAGPWRHHSGPVSPARFEQDKYACRAQAKTLPDRPGTRWLQEDVFWLDCIKGKGYVRGVE